jgi:hypothetical protein
MHSCIYMYMPPYLGQLENFDRGLECRLGFNDSNTSVLLCRRRDLAMETTHLTSPTQYLSKVFPGFN